MQEAATYLVSKAASVLLCFSCVLSTVKRRIPGASLLILLATSLMLVGIEGNAQGAGISVATVIERLQSGKFVDAERLCGQLLRTDPKSPKLWTLRGVALEHSNRPQEALKAYEQALQYAPDYLPALEGAAQLAYKVKSNNAVPLLERIVRIDPKNSTAHAMLGALEYKEKEFAKAAKEFELSGDLAKSQPAALMEYSVCLIRLDRSAEAIPLLTKLLDLDPKNSIARYDLAVIQWQTGKPTDALATLEPLLKAQPPDSRSMRLAAAIHEAENETPQAVELLRSAIMANPDEIGNYLDFATLAFTHGSFTVGINMVSIGLTRRPDSAALYMARGVLYGQNSDFDKAMDDFEQAHKLDPSNSMASSAEGIAQSQRHNSKEALENFRKQVREHPKDAFGHYLLAEALNWSGTQQKASDYQKNIAEAISNAEIAKRLDPNLVQAYDLLSTLYLQSEQFQKAIDTCRAVLKIMPKDQQALYTLILALRKVGSKDELNSFVQRLTAVRKEEQMENNQKPRYGMLIEQP